MKRVGEMWRSMTNEEKSKWRYDGEEGSKVPGASTFVTHKNITRYRALSVVASL